jgi:hypothetical protein
MCSGQNKIWIYSSEGEYIRVFFFFLFLTHFAKNLGNHGFNRYAIGNRGFNEESSSSEKGGTDQKLWFLNQIITMATHQK